MENDNKTPWLGYLLIAGVVLLFLSPFLVFGLLG